MPGQGVEWRAAADLCLDLRSPMGVSPLTLATPEALLSRSQAAQSTNKQSYQVCSHPIRPLIHHMVGRGIKVAWWPCCISSCITSGLCFKEVHCHHTESKMLSSTATAEALFLSHCSGSAGLRARAEAPAAEVQPPQGKGGSCGLQTHLERQGHQEPLQRGHVLLAACAPCWLCLPG